MDFNILWRHNYIYFRVKFVILKKRATDQCDMTFFLKNLNMT